MNYIARLLKVLSCLFPSKLPVGDAQFDDWAKSIFEVYNLEDKPGNRHALASLTMHLGPVTHSKPKAYFARAIYKSLANETAFETIQRLRKDEEAYIAKHMGKADATGLVSPPEPVEHQEEFPICATEQPLA